MNAEDPITVPQMTLDSGVGLGRSLALRLGVPVGTVLGLMVVAGLGRGNSGMVWGGFIAAAIIVLILGIEVGLFRASARRAQRRRLASAPSGTLFVAPAVPAGSIWPRRSMLGLLTVTAHHIEYTPPGGMDQPTRLRWDEVAHLTVQQPSKRAPLRGRVAVDGGFGRGFAVDFRGPGALVTVLRKARSSR